MRKKLLDIKDMYEMGLYTENEYMGLIIDAITLNDKDIPFEQHIMTAFFKIYVVKSEAEIPLEAINKLALCEFDFMQHLA